jgi:hypothetical protein
MQPYTVVWSKIMDDQILEIWLDHPEERRAISTAVNDISKKLRRSPQTTGTHLFDTVYALTVDPLHIEYEINDGDRQVVVLAVWYIPDD